MAADGIPVLLRLLPVMSTTSSLCNQLLPQYFTSFFARGAPRVLGLLATTVISSGAILRHANDTQVNDARLWYIAGLSFAIAHLAWVPSILPPVRAIENDAKGQNVAHLEHWLRLHAWRSLTVDVGAWICCVVATIRSLS
ncbi:hypothetical protein GGS24DRAFT_501319 [Hypoxylon argillaceum]|nr:hypothetical protein GGS24DRAFT_501319 [Hypoxylon argillaceum]